jgi:hypothetical protein
MDMGLANYVIRYYHNYMTKQENMALAHLTATMKITHGRSDSTAQLEARKTKPHLCPPLTDDPEVLDLASEGYEPFAERTAQRIFAAHGSGIYLNHCPKCGALAYTPKARQCKKCFHDWHDKPADLTSV